MRVRRSEFATKNTEQLGPEGVYGHEITLLVLKAIPRVRVCKMACKSCSSDITPNDKNLCCGLCESKFHVWECVTNYDIMSKLKNVHWFCDDCNMEDIMTELRELKDMKRQINYMNRKIKILTEKIECRALS